MKGESPSYLDGRIFLNLELENSVVVAEMSINLQGRRL
jgi:hypothetical protein